MQWKFSNLIICDTENKITYIHFIDIYKEWMGESYGS